MLERHCSGVDGGSDTEYKKMAKLALEESEIEELLNSMIDDEDDGGRIKAASKGQ